MINGRVLLDGAHRYTDSAPEITKEARGKWLVRYNGYCVYIEQFIGKISGCRNYDVTIHDEKFDSWEHCIITRHAVSRYKQRQKEVKGGKFNCLVDILKTMLSREVRFSNATNRVYYEENNNDICKVFAYDLLEDGTIIYKTFFPKPKTLCK